MQAHAIYRDATSSQQKMQLRAEAAALRLRIPAASGAVAATSIAALGLKLFETLPHVLVAGGYSPIRGELDPTLLLECLYAKKIEVCLPVTGPGPALTFRMWTPGSPPRRGKFGLSEPHDACPEAIPHAVLVPLLAFDAAGNRLGYGGGYYDSALRTLRRTARVIAIGLGFDEQQLLDIPREPQDETLDMILTPTRVIACGD